MTEYYTQQDLINAKKSLIKVVVPFIVACLAYVGFSIFIVVSFVNLPYKDSREITLQVLLIAFTAFFVVFAYIYAGIKIRRTIKYYKLINTLETGLKTTSTGKLIEYSELIETYNYADVKTITFSVYNERFTSNFDRNVYVPYEKDFPKIEVGKTVEFITVGNLLHSYKIVD